ncbi:glutathione peroxidase [Azoarcus taiwanensis]|uniref:Glutathione peroxidase n=1 Tax=Azoarcus taiwanensis TaxID=666964 RepID=A0A972FKM2_9RHOO|nr:glutathione peroxidase [Azoarcus taiwanensis]NMG04021.1 redoxin domain-containing protein [Azoarcus taiwanensis]
MSTVFDFELRALDGKPLPLSAYAGSVLLIVNTASHCGFTPQYAGLQALHERFADRGLVVIGVPCNQFGGQEPGSETEIAEFCQSRYSVTFPMAEKVEVNGPNANPLFAYLTKAAPGLAGTTAIKWNFTKFLVGRDGRLIERFAPTTSPESLASAIEALL